jgi:hypothetical protein
MSRVISLDCPMPVETLILTRIVEPLFYVGRLLPRGKLSVLRRDVFGTRPSHYLRDISLLQLAEKSGKVSCSPDDIKMYRCLVYHHK